MLRSATTGSEVRDLLGLYLFDARSRADRAWVMLNMVASVDGATAVDGVSSGLGDDDDLALFKVLRGVSDVILVGAGTVRAEDYGPVAMDAERRRRRIEVGKEEVPRLAIVSGRLSIDPAAKVFSNPKRPPLVFTLTGADSERVRALNQVAEVVEMDSLDPVSILSQMSKDAVVLCEGGPTLNGQLIEAGVVDEVNLTVAPLLVSGDSRRVAHGRSGESQLSTSLDRVLYGDRSLFLRYLTQHDN